jgi:hypothetical protein
MSESDDLNRVAGVALDRVQPRPDSVWRAMPCHVDHGDVARAGVEEGLKLALRLLQEQSGVTTSPEPGHADASPALEPNSLRRAVETEQTWR